MGLAPLSGAQSGHRIEHHRKRLQTSEAFNNFGSVLHVPED